MSFKTYWEDNGIYWVFSGDLTNDDLWNCNQELYSDPRFSSIDYQLCNFLEVKDFSIESGMIKRLSQEDAKQYLINPKINVVVIATKLAVVGLTNMYQAYFELAGNQGTWQVEIFADEDSARDWIKKQSESVGNK